MSTVSTTYDDTLTQPRQHLLVHLEQPLQPVLVYVQVWQIRQEVVPHEHCQKHKVVDDTFEAIVERQDGLDISKLEIEILPHEC